MSLQQSAFVNFEQCKVTEGAAFLGHWRALAIQDPGQGAGVLLSSSPENIALLNLADWRQVEGALLQLDSERVRPAVLHRWALAHSGKEFLLPWLHLLRLEPDHALFVLENHPDPSPEAWEVADFAELLESRVPKIREFGIRLFGAAREGALSRVKLRQLIREPAPQRGR